MLAIRKIKECLNKRLIFLLLSFRKILGGNKKDKSVFFNAKFSKPDEFEDFININIVPL